MNALKINLMMIIASKNWAVENLRIWEINEEQQILTYKINLATTQFGFHMGKLVKSHILSRCNKRL